MSADPGKAAMRAEVAEGLSREPRELSPKWFYDQRGSELFEAITRLPEYYPTRAERRLLVEEAPAWVRDLAPGTLVELGAGAADKTRALLDAMVAHAAGPLAFVPVDISGDYLANVAAVLRRDYATVDVRPVVADMSRGFHVPDGLPAPILFALLGGTIGNFDGAAARELLRRIRAEMAPGDRFLMGVDLVKETAILEAAYNDAAGVTAEFNLNVLRVLNRELGADFDLDAFHHAAHYDPDRTRIEMHLVANAPTHVTIPGAGTFEFAAGESIRTEISCKYRRPEAEALFRDAGLSMRDWVTTEPGFALTLAAPD